MDNSINFKMFNCIIAIGFALVFANGVSIAEPQAKKGKNADLLTYNDGEFAMDFFG